MPPTDGVIWTQKADGIYAEKVNYGLAASRAGIAVGDKLLGIGLNENQIDELVSPADVQMYLETAGADGNLTYFYQRPSYSFSDNFYFADLKKIDTVPRWSAAIIFLTIVGLIWLGIGLFVLLKQGGDSPFVLHFAVVCLAAFVFLVYKPLGLGEDFDLAVSLIDDLAFAFFVPLFLHFCLRYPVRTELFQTPRWREYLLYLPASLISFGIFFLSLFFHLFPTTNAAARLSEFADKYDAFGFLYQANLYHFVAGLTAGAVFLFWRFIKNKQTLVRQRLKWIVWGTLAAVFPVAVFYSVKKYFHLPEDTITSALTILPLALIPLSFGHSVVRYRLMDVDVVVRRALVYAMTTLAIAMMIGAVALGLVFLAVGNNLSNTEITLRTLIAIVAMAGIVMLSEPIKKFLQERADRFFYGERYDLRQGLLDFGRTLAATTTLDPLLNSLTERLQQVLNVEKVAVFIEEENSENYRNCKNCRIK